MRWANLSGVAKAAVIFAVLGFVIALSSTSTSSINGVTTCSHMNYGALLFGALAMMAGAAGLIGLRDLPAETRSLNIAVLVAADLVGVLHVLRGIGIIGGPCG